MRPNRGWREQQAEAAKLDAAIEANLARLGFPATKEGLG